MFIKNISSFGHDIRRTNKTINSISTSTAYNTQKNSMLSTKIAQNIIESLQDVAFIQNEETKIYKKLVLIISVWAQRKYS